MSGIKSFAVVHYRSMQGGEAVHCAKAVVVDVDETVSAVVQRAEREFAPGVVMTVSIRVRKD